MRSSPEFLNASEAARRLGISVKALRLYERRGLIAPGRTAAGWRAYGPDEMSRASDIAALRALGFSLAQVARALNGDVAGLDPALAAHQATLEGQIRELAARVVSVRGLRDELARGQAPTIGAMAQLPAPAIQPHLAFDLPWPWGGEQFELRDLRPLTYITGPLGSGKTRFAKRLAEALTGARFLGLDRLADGGADTRARLEADRALEARVDRTRASIAAHGGAVSDALVDLLVALESEGPSALVIDMIEQGLDRATQQALVARLRSCQSVARPLFILTRSSVILDLEAVGAGEAIIYCPANHSMPLRVAPCPGAPGYEALASCLASPDVRARTEGVAAWRPAVA